MGARWTEQDIGILAEYYPKAGPAVVARRLGRTYQAAHRKAFLLGIAHKPDWTEEDEKRLAQMAPNGLKRKEAERLRAECPTFAHRTIRALMEKSIRLRDAKGKSPKAPQSS